VFNVAVYNVRRYFGWRHDLTSHPDMFVRLIEDFGGTLSTRFGVIKTVGPKTVLDAASRRPKAPPEPHRE
jgi:hypothetical protein